MMTRMNLSHSTHKTHILLLTHTLSLFKLYAQFAKDSQDFFYVWQHICNIDGTLGLSVLMCAHKDDATTVEVT